MNTCQCCSGENDAIGQKESSSFCPQCHTEGVSVSTTTVEHLVMDLFRQEVTASQYRICMDPDCDVVYFGPHPKDLFTKDQIKVPIWFKREASPKYACYCSKVTEEEVMQAVAKLGTTSLKEIIEATGAMQNSHCIEQNPLGVCCHKILEEAIEKAN